MFEIRFHGRGGQGTVLLAKMIADVVLRSGRGECMAIPEFGVERRGAPVLAYARVSDKPIHVRTRIYAPDAVAVLDTAFANNPALTAGLKKGGVIVLNTEEPPAALAARFPGFATRAVPAKRIALAHQLGSATSPVVNTAMCGAICAIFDLADQAALEAAIREAVPVKHDENAAAAREAFLLCSRKEKAHAAA
ncbi:MAG TPA: pyruvate ferredoxin oxidoreductase [Elusimicrobia bacterium]|nr:MAG: hypothetical protein A2X37_05345 [Elusimicrobia bacterium GWA2_66_18]HAZ07442.1 pyruvate ferredoxin oxidoreductase [Elusimicrobiota bacterium]